MSIDIYADGANKDDILQLYKNNQIAGFTTNPTLMKQARIDNYKSFARSILKEINDKPISFEVFADEMNEMERQAVEINSWGSNVNVKIPIMNTKKNSTVPLIKNLVEKQIYCNVTAIFTIEQIKSIIKVIQKDTEIILSIFAGRIADTGIDPIPIMEEAVEICKKFPKVKILWASPREVLNIVQAEQAGCHIITVSNDLLNKMSLFGKDLNEFSLETVKMFFDDAKSSGFNI